MSVLEKVVYQHVEEASFLALLRDDAENNPQYDFKDLQELDERLEAHLDGLRVAGEQSWPSIDEQLVFEESGEVFVAAFMAMELNNTERFDSVFKVVDENEEAAPGLTWALKWQDWKNIEPHLNVLLDSERSFVRAAVIAAMALHRKSRLSTLEDALYQQDKDVRVEACKALAFREGKNFEKELKKSLKSDCDACRYWSAFVLVMYDPKLKAALDVLKDLALGDGEYARSAVELYGRVAIPRHVTKLITELEQLEKMEQVAHAVGALGQIAMIEKLYPLMEDDAFARAAGEAFCMITGADLDRDDLERENPLQDEESRDDPDDKNVAWEGDDDLDWPDSHLTRAWLNENREQFSAPGRYLCGALIKPSHMKNLLEEGFQRQRLAAAIELKFLEHDYALFDCKAPTRIQLQRIID